MRAYFSTIVLVGVSPVIMSGRFRRAKHEDRTAAPPRGAILECDLTQLATGNTVCIAPRTGFGPHRPDRSRVL